MGKQSIETYKCFKIEASELIDKLTRGCLALEKGDQTEELIHELNRAAHSLKGAARLVEFYEIENIAHWLEDAFVKFEKQDTLPSSEEMIGLLGRIDELQQAVNDALALIEGVDEKPTLLTKNDLASKLQSRKKSKTVETCKDVHKLGWSAEVTETVARVSTHTLDEMGRYVGEILELGGRMEELRKNFHRIRRSILPAAIAIDEARKASELASAYGTRITGEAQLLPASLERIDTDELRIRSRETLQEMDDCLDVIGPLGRRLHSLTLEARTVSIKEIAHRFEKAVRDVVWHVHHEAKFELIGGDIRIDRYTLQQLTGPICHLLGNAVVHGIEPPEKRRELNKPVEGRICLLFKEQTNSLRVIVEDDGSGLNINTIRKASDIKDDRETNDVENLIFQVGVTTQKQVSTVAGRGLGLDVVRDAVEKLRGKVKVESEPGQFCRFTIDVPSNLDVMEVFVVRVGGQDILVPLTSVVRTCIATYETIVNHAGADAILLRESTLHETEKVESQPLDEQSVRLYSLAQLLGIKSETVNKGRYPVAVIKSQFNFAVAVDSLVGKQRVLIKSPGPQLTSCNVLAGVAIMKDGRPGFLLDIDALANLTRQGRFSVYHKTESKRTVRRSVLVVDDSLTTRMLEKTLLEAAGYRVLLANFGSHALKILSQTSCDLAILDFEMPDLNGLELAERIRETPGLSDLPMIMLTSYSDDETKRKSLAAGVQAYLTKGQFDQTKFLDTVRKLIGQPMEEL